MKRVLCMIAVLVLAMASGFSVGAETCLKAEMPPVSSLSAVLYEPTTKTVLCEKDAHTKRPMASTTKLMTALLAEECLSWERVVTVPAAASGIEGTTLGLKPNDTLSVGDLVTGMLLESGNDAATALALLIDGDVETFAQRMNQKAKELGMNDSRFVTPSGLDADGHAASAYDMALLGAAVLSKPHLADVCAKKSAEITISGRKVTVCNHNRLLSMVDGCVGLKTGYTDNAKRCLVSAVKRDGLMLIAVTLNGHEYWSDHKALYEAGFSAVKAATLSPPVLPPLSVAGGTEKTVQLKADPVTAVLPKSADMSDVTSVVTWQTPVLFAPIKAGQTVGTVTYSLNGQQIATAEITTKNAVSGAPAVSFWRRTADTFIVLFHSLFTFR